MSVLCIVLCLYILIGIEDDKAAHLDAAFDLAENVRVPWAGDNPLDDDLEFAIAQTISNAEDLRSYRRAIMVRVNELKSMLSEVKDCMKLFPVPAWDDRTRLSCYVPINTQVCINQSDPELKRKGINAIDLFLARSRRLRTRKGRRA